jgi:hypothetical protein
MFKRCSRGVGSYPTFITTIPYIKPTKIYISNGLIKAYVHMSLVENNIYIDSVDFLIGRENFTYLIKGIKERVEIEKDWLTKLLKKDILNTEEIDYSIKHRSRFLNKLSFFYLTVPNVYLVKNLGGDYIGGWTKDFQPNMLNTNSYYFNTLIVEAFRRGLENCNKTLESLREGSSYVIPFS